MPDNGPEEHGYPADKARRGEIILRKRGQRVVFIVGLAGSIVLALVWQLAAYR